MISFVITLTLLSAPPWSSSMSIREEYLPLIKEFEGYSSTPYYCSAGERTIGYGHVLRPGESYVSISKEKAEALLKRDLETAEEAVSRLVTVPLNAHQYAALVFFTYNIGAHAFEKSTLLRRLNAHDYASVPSQMRRWNRSRGVVSKGLTNRRKKEINLWLGK